MIILKIYLMQIQKLNQELDETKEELDEAYEKIKEQNKIIEELKRKYEAPINDDDNKKPKFQ